MGACRPGAQHLDACLHGPVAALQARQHGRPLRLRARAELVASPERPSSTPTRRAGPLLVLFLLVPIGPLERVRCQALQVVGSRVSDC